MMAAWGRTVPGTHGSKHGPGWRAVDGTGTTRTGFLNALTLVAEKPHSTIYSTYEQLTGCGLGSLTSHPTWPSSTLSNGVLGMGHARRHGMHTQLVGMVSLAGKKRHKRRNCRTAAGVVPLRATRRTSFPPSRAA